MSVYTTVTHAQLAEWLKDYSLGELQRMQGILSGIENTNYFVTTTRGQFVLTLFEHIGADQLPYYAQLMAHLAGRGLACPIPAANSSGKFIGQLNGKPALLVTRLPGESVVRVSTHQCEQVGGVLARLHAAGQGFTQRMLNPRGAHWWKSYSQLLRPKISSDELRLIESEIDFQAQQAQRARTNLPHGVIHGDLFRDNVLFESNGSKDVGVIDFYFACDDALLFDVAITANDWCLRPNATLDMDQLASLLRGYRPDHKYTDAEKYAWPILLRAAALRTWMSRLGYNHFPLQGEMTITKDAGLYQRLLLQHMAAPAYIDMPM